MRQIILDTETTGLDPKEGHRIIEIGCIEMDSRRLTKRHFHQYINPDREIDQGAIDVHGITNEFLVDKPLFKDVFQAFIEFVQGAELVIHNAPFDVGFIDHEIKLLSPKLPLIGESCTVLDTLKLARKKHPGQRNSLDALCKRYFIDNSKRELHGALLDSEILAEVYLAMTGGQMSFDLSALGSDDSSSANNSSSAKKQPQNLSGVSGDRQAIPIHRATQNELDAHKVLLEKIAKTSQVEELW